MIISDFHQKTCNQFVDKEISIVNLTRSKILFDEEDPLNYIFFVSKGRLDILKKGQLIWQAGPSEFIGISSFFTHDNFYSYQVIASEKSQVYKISIADFEQAIKESQSLSLSVMNLFNRRINTTRSLFLS